MSNKLSSIMVSALSYLDLLVFSAAGDPINQPMFTSDASGPPALQGMLERLRFPESLKRIASYIFDQIVDRRENLGVDPLPMEIILPSAVCPNQLHAAEFI